MITRNVIVVRGNLHYTADGAGRQTRYGDSAQQRGSRYTEQDLGYERQSKSQYPWYIQTASKHSTQYILINVDAGGKTTLLTSPARPVVLSSR